MGHADVSVYPNPAVSIIVTGNELQKPGNPLQHGQVYESNSVALASVLRHLDFDRVEVVYVTDEPELITGTLEMRCKKLM